jgi:hypothetical protein
MLVVEGRCGSPGANIAAGTVVAAGIVSLAAWLAGLVNWLRLIPSSSVIGPTTACLILAAGVGLWRLAWLPRRRDAAVLGLGVYSKDRHSVFQQLEPELLGR